jgi:hypothetical protein
MVLRFLVQVAHFESYIFLFSITSSCTKNGHPVVLSLERDKSTKVTV